MNNTLSTLMNLGIYILLVAAGAVVGSRKAVRSRELKWLSKLQFIALMILIVSLGVNLGAKDEIIASLGEIGIAALVITVAALAGSVL
ncbi:MAG: LysO family transporter, partial [Oscillospiraceae bacterium]